ncbi:hypothetical protein RvY_03202 [Ramazzottius varieornatus]|uniref:Uncharacterized protein n=1 Tax=Ramazzottius varieornatus TaxID=947166 RepID=A0A1D1UQP0_RAMVA|nr:hypothetical protein RvY_03202 [Ramazzottius varieornatus]
MIPSKMQPSSKSARFSKHKRQSSGPLARNGRLIVDCFTRLPRLANAPFNPVVGPDNPMLSQCNLQQTQLGLEDDPPTERSEDASTTEGIILRRVARSLPVNLSNGSNE